MNALLIDTVEYPQDWPERRVLTEWFGPLLSTVDHLQLGAVAASDPACATRTAITSDATHAAGTSRATGNNARK